MKYFKTLILLVIFLISLTAIVSSCKKDNNSKLISRTSPNALIINSGPVAADGCGWLVKINGTNEEYSPINLSSAYEIDSLKVNITYHILTSKLSCGSFAGGGGVTQIQVDAIKTQ